MHDAFSKRLSEAIASKTLGPAEDPANQIGPVIDEESRARIEKRIDESKQSATLIYRANVSNLLDDGFYVGPAIFANADPKSDLCQQEIFGPVIALIPYDTLEQAIAIANDSPYALTAGIYSRNPESISLISALWWLQVKWRWLQSRWHRLFVAICPSKDYYREYTQARFCSRSAHPRL
jgi:RHH-type proline utilization regulon transcriptional repressor/proline dehydrogenase/delta 1-pyrroline-5-carboxylate dehydrogenase